MKKILFMQQCKSFNNFKSLVTKPERVTSHMIDGAVTITNITYLSTLENTPYYLDIKIMKIKSYSLCVVEYGAGNDFKVFCFVLSNDLDRDKIPL